MFSSYIFKKGGKEIKLRHENEIIKSWKCERFVVEEGRKQEESGGLQLLILKLPETGTESGGMLAPSDVDVCTMLHIQWRHVAENDVKLYKMLIQWRHVGREWWCIYSAVYAVAACRQVMLFIQWRHVGRKRREIIQNAHPVAACRQRMMTYTQRYLCSGGM